MLAVDSLYLCGCVVDVKQVTHVCNENSGWVEYINYVIFVRKRDHDHKIQGGWRKRPTGGKYCADRVLTCCA